MKVHTQKETSPNIWIWVLSCLFLILLGGLLFFVYFFLPQKIAHSILTRSQTRAEVRWTPQEDGFHYRDVSFMTADHVQISGWWMPSIARKPLGTVLLTHGIFKSREQVLSRAEFLAKAGYQVLLFDQRGEGLSGASPVSGGFLEAGDFLAAAEYVKTKKLLVRPLVFMGFSMGAISAIRAGAQDAEVDGVIADSPLPNGKSYVSRRTLGGVFTAMPGFLSACLRDYDLLTGLSLTTADLDLAPVVIQFNEVPILFITGEADDLAKSSEVSALFDMTRSHHRSLVYIPNAGHEQTYTAQPQTYEQSVKNFLEAVRTHFPEPNQEELLKTAKVLVISPKKKGTVGKLKDLFQKKATATVPQ